MVDRFRLSSLEQAAEVKEIPAGINPIAQTAGVWAGSSEECAAAREQLSAQASTLAKIAADLQEMADGEA